MAFLQGIRSIECCPQIGANPAGRYLIIGGPANGGPIEKEVVGETFSLWSWLGPDQANPANTPPPILAIPDLRSYTVRPEGFAVINVNGQDRILFVEDRFRATGYGTRNAIHWPLSILPNNL